jgi:XH domain
MSGQKTLIGIKRMGELNEKPFDAACKRRYGHEDAEIKAAELISRWQDELKKPAWHPYKRVEIGGVTKVLQKSRPSCVLVVPATHKSLFHIYRWSDKGITKE